MHIQCDVAQCVGVCAEDVCPGDILSASSVKGGRPGNKEDGSSLAATTVFVLDPDQAPCMFFIIFLLFFWSNISKELIRLFIR